MKKKYDRELTLEELAALPDEEIDTSDISVLDETFWKNARLVEPRSKTDWARANAMTREQIEAAADSDDEQEGLAVDWTQGQIGLPK